MSGNTYIDSLKDLMQIPGVGKSIANDLINIGIKSVSELKGKSPDDLYHKSNRHAGMVQDRCLLYVFRCAVYFANTKRHNPEKLKWWNWKDKAGRIRAGRIRNGGIRAGR